MVISRISLIIRASSGCTCPSAAATRSAILITNPRERRSSHTGSLLGAPTNTVPASVPYCCLEGRVAWPFRSSHFRPYAASANPRETSAWLGLRGFELAEGVAEPRFK
jgi:hypothetical protein